MHYRNLQLNSGVCQTINSTWRRPKAFMLTGQHTSLHMAASRKTGVLRNIRVYQGHQRGTWEYKERASTVTTKFDVRFPHSPFNCPGGWT